MFRMFSPVINATFEGSTGIYGHHELAGCTVFCRYVGAQFFSVIWPKYHIIKDSALLTSYLTVTSQQMLRHSSPLLKYKKHYWTLYLFNQQLFYLPSYCKQTKILQTARRTSFTREAGRIMRFDWQFEEPMTLRGLVVVASLLLVQDQWSLAVIFPIWAWVSEMLWIM